MNKPTGFTRLSLSQSQSLSDTRNRKSNDALVFFENCEGAFVFYVIETIIINDKSPNYKRTITKVQDII